MSRHSKNCTSSGVFTYAERQKLLNEKGTGFNTAAARIGQDSQKKFDECGLCLSRVTGGGAGAVGNGSSWSKSSAPVCCPQGHIYCRECFIENLVTQKKRTEKLQAEWEFQEKQSKLKEQKEAEKKHYDKVKAFENTQNALPEAKETQASSKDLSDQAKEVQKAKAHLQDKEIVALDKKEWLKTSFWTPENAEGIKSEMKGPPSKKTFCPINASTDAKHSVRLKEMIPLRFNNEIVDGSEKFICWVCQKGLGFQKMSVLKECGHVMCAKCVTLSGAANRLRKGIKCSECSAVSDGVVSLDVSGSAYSAHSKVETKVQQPCFQ